MLRSTVTTIASAINYGVAMATTALVVHVATGGLLPAQATIGLVLAAGGLYALCTAAVVQRVDTVPVHAPQPALATVTPMRARVIEDQPAIAFASRPSSMSA